jgi:Mn2+/Fe2+ NRAMP family transporter
VIKLLVLIQVLNGVLLPIFLVFILLLINDQRLTKELKNTRFSNILGWATFAIIALAVAIMLLMQFLNLWGVKLFES